MSAGRVALHGLSIVRPSSRRYCKKDPVALLVDDHPRVRQVCTPISCHALKGA